MNETFLAGGLKPFKKEVIWYSLSRKGLEKTKHGKTVFLLLLVGQKMKNNNVTISMVLILIIVIIVFDVFFSSLVFTIVKLFCHYDHCWVHWALLLMYWFITVYSSTCLSNMLKMFYK